MCYQVIAECLSEEEIAGLREIFTAMDTGKSGAITFDELKAGLQRYGATLKDTEIQDLMNAVSLFMKQISKYLFHFSSFHLYIFFVLLLLPLVEMSGYMFS